MNNQDIEQRWENYRKANSDKPGARENELKEIFSLLDPKQGEKIWEVGTGNGYLTFPLAEAVGKTGEVISTDIHESNLSDAINKNQEKKLNISARLLPVDSPLLGDEYESFFDAVATIATLHHFDNRKNGTGEAGRMNAIRGFYRTLKKGGRLVMSDPLKGGITQKYFDAVDNPKHCYPDSHPHDFFTKERLESLLQEIGFKDISIEVTYVPWKFASPDEAVNFVHTIHNAKCTPEESFTVAKDILGFKKVGGHYELGWELFFLTASK
ncbi:MAG: methyltransferase domain-containing protein [Patescibacteria group bacterium]